jgi:hypothetical protein
MWTQHISSSDGGVTSVGGQNDDGSEGGLKCAIEEGK